MLCNRLLVGNFALVHVGLFTVGGFLTAAMIVGADQRIKY